MWWWFLRVRVVWWWFLRVRVCVVVDSGAGVWWWFFGCGLCGGGFGCGLCGGGGFGWWLCRGGFIGCGLRGRSGLLLLGVVDARIRGRRGGCVLRAGARCDLAAGCCLIGGHFDGVFLGDLDAFGDLDVLGDLDAFGDFDAFGDLDAFGDFDRGVGVRGRGPACSIRCGHGRPRRQCVDLPGLLCGRRSPQAPPQPDQAHGGSRRAGGVDEERSAGADPLAPADRILLIRLIGARGAPDGHGRPADEKQRGGRAQPGRCQCHDPRSRRWADRVAGRGPAADQTEHGESCDRGDPVSPGRETAEQAADSQRDDDDAHRENGLLAGAQILDAERHDRTRRVVGDHLTHCDHERRNRLAGALDQLAEAQRHRRSQDPCQESCQPACGGVA